MSGMLAAVGAAAASNPLRASAAPGFASGTGAVGPFTVTAAGGVAPYSYLWQQVSGNAQTANSPTNVATTISAAGDTAGIWRCRVTDAVGQIVYTNTVEADTTHVGGGG